MPKTGPDGSPFTPEALPREGTTTTPAGIELEYLTVQSAAAEAIAGAEGWTDLATASAYASR